jgi:hypothetical protein
MTEVRIEHVGEIQIKRFVEFSEKSGMPEHLRNHQHVQWKFEAIPGERTQAVEIFLGDVTVGRLWLTWRSWHVNGRLSLVAFPNDLVVLPDSRDLKSISSLLRAVFEEAETKSDFYYHGSNPNSEPLYQSLFRRQPSLSLQVCVIPVRPLAVLVQLLSRIRKHGERVAAVVSLATNRAPTSLGRADHSYKASLRAKLSGVEVREPSTEEKTALFSEFHELQTIASSRMQLWSDWRLSPTSSIPYVRKWIWSRNKCVGYIAFADYCILGIKVRVVIDVVFTRKLRLRMRLGIIALIIDRYCPSLLLFAGNRNNEALRKFMRPPFIRVPNTLLPQKLNIYFQSGASVKDAVNVDDFVDRSYMTLYDLDLF